MVSKTLPALEAQLWEPVPDAPQTLHPVQSPLHLCLIFQVELSGAAGARWDTDAEIALHWPQDGSDGVVRAVGTVSQRKPGTCGRTQAPDTSLNQEAP